MADVKLTAWKPLPPGELEHGTWGRRVDYCAQAICGDVMCLAYLYATERQRPAHEVRAIMEARAEAALNTVREKGDGRDRGI